MPTLGLVLSGGGARGAFQVGVIERLLEDARFAAGPTVLSGTSAGGINAALLAAGKTPAEMMAFWHAIGTNPPVIASQLFFEGVLRGVLRLTLGEIRRWLSGPTLFLAFLQRLKNHLSPAPSSVLALWVEYLLTQRFELVSQLLETIREPYLADTTPLRERLVDVLGGERVPTRGTRLAISTVDAHTGQVVRFVSAPSPATRSPAYVVVEAITVDMVLASASIPLLFPPVEIGPHLCWDGGLLVNTPLAPVVALGRRRDHHRPGHRTARSDQRAVRALRASRRAHRRHLPRERLQRRPQAPARAQPPRAGATSERALPRRHALQSGAAAARRYLQRRLVPLLRGEVLDSMYESGLRAATKWLAAGPVVDHLDEPPSPPVASNARRHDSGSVRRHRRAQATGDE